MLDIHVVSHTHWDREWYLTFEQFRMRLVALVDRVLDLLDANPDYKHFHLDGQTVVLEDYLEIRPEQEARLRTAIAAGRVLVGPWYVMPDEFLVSGESIVRNLVRGHQIATRFGTAMPVGYLPDLFGHVAQMPQIWRQFGLDNTILWRGFGGPKAEYWWDAPDGSRVLMMHLPPEGYCNATRIVFDPDAVMDRAAKAVGFERDRTAVGQALLMNGVDHVEPQIQIPDLIARLSSLDGQRAHHSTLPQYVAAVRAAVDAQTPALDAVTGELRGGEDYANLLPGVLSARVYLKQQNARVQTLLESYAEPLSVFAAAVTPFRYPAGALRHAWKTLLQNHPHDSICGCSIDAVHEENMTRFARAGQVADGVIDAALQAVADTVPAAGTGTLRVLAVNPDANARTQVVDACIDLPIESAEPWRTVDPQILDRPVTFWPADAAIASVVAVGGAAVPFQIVGEERVVIHEMSRFETPWALHARRLHLLWWAPSIPPCGYAAFDIEFHHAAGHAAGSGGHPSRGVAAAATSELVVPAIENDVLHLTVSDDGTFDVTDKSTSATWRGVGLLEDTGDVGDEYNYCPPATDRRVTTLDARNVRVSRTAHGPLRSALRVELELPLPATAGANRLERDTATVDVPVTIDAALDAGAPRVIFSVTVNNAARDHRLRMLFPTGAAQVAFSRADTAFDVVRRPARRDVPATIKNEAPVSSFPMISVVDSGDDRIGATVIGKGLMEYEVVVDESTQQQSIALTLIRGVGDLSRNDLATRPSGHAGPPVATPGAQCLGVHRFEAAFQPRGQAPSAGALIKSARTVNIPSRIIAAKRTDGKAETARSFLNVTTSGGAAVLSALKKAEDRDTTIVRLFNPDDVEANVCVTMGIPIGAAYRVNFLEERQEPIAIDGTGIRIRLKPHEIRTIELI
jgi:alpha-mannosidase